jgi:hypothetical protein
MIGYRKMQQIRALAGRLLNAMFPRARDGGAAVQL